MLHVSETWRAAYPGASIGLLAMRGASNPEHHPLLEQRRAELRSRYGGLERSQLRALPALQAYGAYYRRFGGRRLVQRALQSGLAHLPHCRHHRRAVHRLCSRRHRGRGERIKADVLLVAPGAEILFIGVRG